jgi:hypothetical protein
MGRPRKRLHVELEEEQASNDAFVASIVPGSIPSIDSTIGMQLDLSFLDVSNSDINFFDLFDPESQPAPPPFSSVEHQEPNYNTNPSASQDDPKAGVDWQMGANYFADINIDFDGPLVPPPPPPAQEIPMAQLVQMIEAVQTMSSPELSDKYLPNLSPGSGDSTLGTVISRPRLAASPPNRSAASSQGRSHCHARGA